MWKNVQERNITNNMNTVNFFLQGHCAFLLQNIEYIQKNIVYLAILDNFTQELYLDFYMCCPLTSFFCGKMREEDILEHQ